MIPLFFTLLGLTIIVLALYVLKKTGGMWYRRKVREAISEDEKRFSSKDKVG